MTTLEKGSSHGSVRAKRSLRSTRSSSSARSLSTSDAASSTGRKKRFYAFGARASTSSKSGSSTSGGSSRRLLAKKSSSEVKRKRKRHPPPGLKAKVKPKPKAKVKAKGSGGSVAKGKSKDRIKDKEKEKGTGKMFICPVCFRIFSQQTKLKKHMLKHRGVPYTAQDRVLVRQLQRILKSLDSRVTVAPLEEAATATTTNRATSSRPDSVRRWSSRPGSMRPRSLRPDALRAGSLRPSSLRPSSVRPGGTLRPGSLRPKRTHPPSCLRKLRPKRSSVSRVSTIPPLLPPSGSSYYRRRAQYQPHKRYICPICNRTFAWLGQLKRHLQEHRSEKAYKRTKIHFMRTPLDVQEQFLNQRDEGPYRCKICDAEFPSVRTLIRHINHVHGYPRYRKVSLDSSSSAQGSAHRLRDSRSRTSNRSRPGESFD